MKRILELTPELLRAYSRRGNFHSDPELSAALGYEHLVAQGMQVAGPAYGLLLDAWGEEFLAHGTIELKFIAPATDGETVEAAVDPGPDDAAIEVQNISSGRTAVVGRAIRTTSPA
ncbi:MAG: MaoC family dehydratase [Acidimicrobiia bacterium]